MAKRSESFDEIAERYEAMVDDDTQDETFVPVKAQVGGTNSVFATQFSKEEIALITKVAKEHNTPITEFIRAATLAAAAGQLDLTSVGKLEALHDAQAKARDLAQALERL